MKINEQSIIDDSDDFMLKFEKQLDREPAPQWLQVEKFEIPWGQLAFAAAITIIIGSEYKNIQMGLFSLKSILHFSILSPVFLIVVAGFFVLFQLVRPKTWELD